MKFISETESGTVLVEYDKAEWDELVQRVYIPPDLRSLGEQVRSCRREHGISQAEFAKLAGVSRGRLSKIENGDESVLHSTYIALQTARVSVIMRDLAMDFKPDEEESA